STAILGELQRAETTGTAAEGRRAVGRRTGLRDPTRRLSALQSHRPDRLHPPAALNAGRGADEGFAVRRHGHRADRGAAARHLPRSASQTLEINFHLDGLAAFRAFGTHSSTGPRTVGTRSLFLAVDAFDAGFLLFPRQ